MQTPCKLLIFVLTLLSLALSNSDSPENTITLFGDAFLTADSSLALTQELQPCRSSPSSSSLIQFTSFSDDGVGRALYARPVRFLDPLTNTTSSFSSTFSFSVVPSPLCASGDGIAFLIAPETMADAADDPFPAAKGHMGLPGPGFSHKDSFFAVEFDTSFDPLLGDVNDNHVGLDLNSAVSAVSAELGVDLKSGREFTAWIEYRSPLNLVRVWLGDSGIRPKNPILAAEIDLSPLVGEFMFVGFSASNGHGSARQVIRTWKFKTWTYHSSATIPIDELEEGDCFICSDPPQNPVSSVPANHRNGDAHHNPNVKSRLSSRKMKSVLETVLGLGGLVAFVLSVIAIVTVLCFVFTRKKKRKRAAQGRTESLGSWLQSQRVPARLSLAEIRAATMGFDRSRIVGEGASATVYKGSLPHGGEVAVKRFNTVDREVSCSSSNHFSNELATMIGCLRHKNLIQLQGWCSEGSEMFLVYEYMPNGSLDRILHESSTILSLNQRLNIVLGVASALGYLHEDCERQIIHRDVKSCNIMLAADYTAKLADFGLAMAGFGSGSVNAAGTVGYLAPEYVYSGVATTKTDVYGLGVVVLEVATGRRAVDESGVAVADWAWGMWETGRLGEAGVGRSRDVERMLVVGLACVHPNHVKRPTAKEAVRILRQEVPLPALPARKPRLRLRMVLPSEYEEAVDGGGRRSLDDDDNGDDPFMTPRSEFS